MTKKKIDRFLVVRERIRDIRRGELAAAETEVGQAARAADEARRAEQAALAALAAPTVLSADDLSLRARLVVLAGQTASSACATLAERREQRERCAEVATAANRDVRALECLRDRVTLRERAAERLADQAHTDEAAARVAVGRA